MADKPTIRTRVITPHASLPEYDYHEWIDVPKAAISAVYWRDARGYNRPGYYRWASWHCNNTDCNGEIIVCINDIEDIVNA